MARELVTDAALRATFQAVASWPGLALDEVAQASGLPPLQVQRNLHRLADTGLIAPVVRNSLPKGFYVTPHGREALRLLASLVSDATLQALLQAPQFQGKKPEGNGTPPKHLDNGDASQDGLVLAARPPSGPAQI